MTQTKSLVESSLLAGVAVVLFLASYFLPVVGIGFSLLCPAPLVVLGMRHDLQKATLGLVVASILILLILGPVGALFFFLGFGVLGVGLGYLARKMDSGVEIILYGILISLGSKLLLMILASRLTGVNPFSLDPGEMQQIVDRIFLFYEEKGLGGQNLSEVREQLYNSLRMIPLIFPALLSVASAVDCYLSYVVSRVILKRVGSSTLPPLPSFSVWRFPRSIFWALLVSVLLTIIGARGGTWNIWLKIGTNLRLLVNMVFLLQGLSLAWWFLSLKKVHSLIRGSMIVLVLFIPFMSQVALLLGIIDMWFDLRHRIRR
ncbi:MAG: YybS family protein [Synergistales bacterium]|nr:YybS family protein [Synergistales bacterium]